MRTNTPRKSPKEQKLILEKWSASGLTAAAFCRQKNLNYAAFCKWRAASKNSTSKNSAAPNVAPQFIQIATLNPDTHPQGWNIVLQLAPGIELRLTQNL